MSDVITPSHTCGPLFGFAILYDGLNRSCEASDPDAIFVSGEVRDPVGHLNYEGFLEFFAPGQAVRVRTHAGRYEAILKRPQPSALSDGRGEAPHFQVLIHARGLVRHLVTRAYLPGPAFDADPVAGLVNPELRRHLLLKPGADARQFTFDICLRGADESVFFDF